MWLTVTAKMSQGDFSLTGHKGGSVWSHYKCPQIFSTEHSEVLPRKKAPARQDGKYGGNIVSPTICQTIIFLVCFFFLQLFSLFSLNMESPNPICTAVPMTATPAVWLRRSADRHMLPPCHVMPPAASFHFDLTGSPPANTANYVCWNWRYRYRGLH